MFVFHVSILKTPITFIKKIVFPRIFCSESSMAPELLISSKCFEGEQRFYTHYSDTLQCKMNIGVYLPPKAIRDNIKCPVLYFLNGLTATHENMMQKTAFQRFAAKFGLCTVCPDTSPRDVEVPKHEFLGPSASFYLDAVEESWAKHYRMYSYITKELIELINNNFPVIKGKQSISGFSMGGFGAINCALKNPGLYKSVSAFAPICNPIAGGIAKTALEVYLGNNPEEWKKWDPSVLVESYSGPPLSVLIDQGTLDEYTEGKHLLPENFVQSSANNDCVTTIFKKREGYNHSHYFVSTFIHEHIEYHAKFLNSE